MHFRILKMIATSGFLTALECTKSIFGRGSAPDPAGGAYSAPPDPLPGFTGPTSKGGRGGQERGGKGKKRGGRGGESKEERGGDGPQRQLLDPPLSGGHFEEREGKIEAYPQSCCPRGLALASRILEDTS